MQKQKKKNKVMRFQAFLKENGKGIAILDKKILKCESIFKEININTTILKSLTCLQYLKNFSNTQRNENKDLLEFFKILTKKYPEIYQNNLLLSNEITSFLINKIKESKNIKLQLLLMENFIKIINNNDLIKKNYKNMNLILIEIVKLTGKGEIDNKILDDFLKIQVKILFYYNLYSILMILNHIFLFKC